jgi:hypothetical protein
VWLILRMRTHGTQYSMAHWEHLRVQLTDPFHKSQQHVLLFWRFTALGRCRDAGSLMRLEYLRYPPGARRTWKSVVYRERVPEGDERGKGATGSTDSGEVRGPAAGGGADSLPCQKRCRAQLDAGSVVACPGQAPQNKGKTTRSVIPTKEGNKKTPKRGKKRHKKEGIQD